MDKDGNYGKRIQYGIFGCLQYGVSIRQSGVDI